MDDGSQPEEPSPAIETAPSEPSPPGRSTRWVRLGVITIVVVLLAGGGLAFVSLRDGNGYPDQWEDRVGDLAEFVEDERHLDFEHPVSVEFLKDREFREVVVSKLEELDKRERKEIEDSAAVMRALGLIDDDVDLFDSVRKLSGEGALAFYDPEDERVRVRGTKMTPALRATLVHELTHALQDQHFDLERLEELEREEEGASAALRGLVEGDAIQVQSAYVSSLNSKDRRQVADQAERQQEELDVDRFPAVLTALFVAPYALGAPLASTIAAEHGEDGINRALRKPPRSDEALVDPLTFLEGDQPERVRAPSSSEDGRRLDSGAFGALSWYIVLVQRIDPLRALEAVGGWGGDAFVAFRQDDRVCIRIAYKGETAADADRLAGALEEWARARPPGAVAIEGRGSDGLVLQSCDLGDEPSAPKVTVEDIMVLPTVRSSVLAATIAGGAERDAASCLANEVVRTFSVDELSAQAQQQDAATLARIQALARKCRVS